MLPLGRAAIHLRPHHTRFVTLAHELAHLFLGHLGKDSALNIPERRRPTLAQRELEAESVAYLVCARNGVASQSERYLCDFVEKSQTIDELDLYQVMRAAGQIETLLGLTNHTQVALSNTLKQDANPFDARCVLATHSRGLSCNIKALCTNIPAAPARNPSPYAFPFLNSDRPSSRTYEERQTDQTPPPCPSCHRQH